MRVYGNFTASGAGLHPETLKVPLILSVGGGLESRVKSSFQPKVQSGETGPPKKQLDMAERGESKACSSNKGLLAVFYET